MKDEKRQAECPSHLSYFILHNSSFIIHPSGTPMNDYDRASRRTAKLDSQSFFNWLLANFEKYLRFERWLDTRTVPFPGDPERIGDTVAELTATEEVAPAWAVPLEFQAEPDPDMFGRLL